MCGFKFNFRDMYDSRSVLKKTVGYYLSYQAN